MKVFIATALALAAVSGMVAADSFEDDFAAFGGFQLFPLTGCKTEQCSLASAKPCQCPSKDLSFDMALEDIPQFVMLTFDDAVNLPVESVFSAFFPDFDSVKSKRTLPFYTQSTKCPMRATFFVSHAETDYSLVNKLWTQGHEIAAHSITHGYGKRDGIKNEPAARWQAEILGGRELLTNLGYVKKDEIRGFRAPNLQPGGQEMYDIMASAGMVYDSTQVARDPVWPFRMDYALPECWIPPCHKTAMPEMWQVPIVQMFGADGEPCSMLDSCYLGSDSNEVASTLMSNYRRFAAHRVPFPFFVHAPSLHRSHEVAMGTSKFFLALAKRPEVHFATVSEVLDWMKKPVKRTVYAQQQAKKCTATRHRPCKPDQCTHRSYKGDEKIFMTVCSEAKCPADLTIRKLMRNFAKKQ